MGRLQKFLSLLGGLLLIQGATVLLCLALSISLPSPWSRAIRPDLLHGWIHVGWAILIWWGLKRGQTVALGWSFGLFYLLFGLLGLAVYHPWGLLLDLGENGFHLLLGSIGLGLAFTTTQTAGRQA